MADRSEITLAEVRERIAATTELPVLQHWLVRAVTIASIDDIFGD